MAKSQHPIKAYCYAARDTSGVLSPLTFSRRHEAVGVVTKVGSKVEKFKIGDKVGVRCMVESCRSCQACATDYEQYCSKQIAIYGSRDVDGTQTYGGFSDTCLLKYFGLDKPGTKWVWLVLVALVMLLSRWPRLLVRKLLFSAPAMLRRKKRLQGLKRDLDTCIICVCLYIFMVSTRSSQEGIHIRNKCPAKMQNRGQRHEAVGVVTEVGSKVEKFKIGDKVGVGCMVESCRSCQACATDYEQYCSKQIAIYGSRDVDGTQTYGGFSDTWLQMSILSYIGLTICHLILVRLCSLGPAKKEYIYETNAQPKCKTEGKGKLEHLEYLDVSDNDLSGTFPTWGSFSKLTEESFKNNPRLEGPELMGSVRYDDNDGN
ncbi:mannitol dehydrogenase [Artemisia annua]|uniref:Mannitol dehydrogenase n=1 Tax=Artemisia annua TaxID=35608 RepID=A0A2U1NWZ4_ARTAN|nr:mannitol dehydrogenase [Artemisia annua]